MAFLVSVANGNFTASSTWKVIDSTSYLNSEAANTSLSTAPSVGTAFTPGAITIEGVGIKINTRNATPSGTMTLSLRNATTFVLVPGTTVTINVSDISPNGVTWIYFKFPSTVTLAAATPYQTILTTSVNAQVNVFTASGTNHSRYLVTSTNAAPAATDTLYIVGEQLGAGSATLYTVTMDNTAATVFGTLVNTALQIGQGGTLGYGVAASTAYQFIAAGPVAVYAGGTMTIGTSANPIPSTSTARLQMNVTTTGQNWLFIRGGTFTTHGAAKTDRAILAANAAAGATSLTSNVATGWLSGDQIAIAPTTATPGSDFRTLASNASGTNVTLTAGIGAARTLVGGTYSIEAEIINVTKNVLIIGTSRTNVYNWTLQGNPTINCQNTEFRFTGSMTTPAPLGGSVAFTSCSFHQTTVTILPGNTVTNFTVDSCVFFDVGVICSGAFSGAAANRFNAQIRNCWVIGANGNVFNAAQYVVMDNCRVVSTTGVGFIFGDGQDRRTNSFIEANNLLVHSCNNGNGGILFSAFYSNPASIFNNFRVYGCSAGFGLLLSNANNVTIEDVVLYGNTTYNLSTGNVTECVFRRFDMQAGPTSPSSRGIFLQALSVNNIYESCTIGNIQPHSVADIRTGSVFGSYNIFRNCLFGSTTEIEGQILQSNGSFVRSARHDQTAGNHRTWKLEGTISADNVIFRSAPRSTRLTPLVSNERLTADNKLVAVKSGQTVTASVWVRKSVIGDGANYNGSQPRLMLRFNAATGAGTSDTVLATMTGANGVWEQLIGMTPAATDDAAFEVYVDCNGTAGWVNVDDWRVS